MEFTQNKIDNTFYDEDTFNMLHFRLNEKDKLFILSSDEDINNLIYRRWNTIISSLMGNYYNEYASMENTDRNKWFQKYLNLPSHNIMEMPVSLLPL